MKFWGRDPQVIAAALSVLVMIVGRFAHWSGDVQGAVTAAVLAGFGVLVAWTVGTRGDGLLALIMGLVKAGIAVALAFRLHLSGDDQALIMTGVTIALTLWLRTQLTAPVARPGAESPQ
jgi:hypothetical protein